MKRAIQSCVLIAVLVMSTLFGSGLLGLISPASAASSLSWLHTEGKYIKNEAGQIVFLRGVALPDLANGLWWNGGTGKLDLIQTLLDGKVNVVRCVISPYPDGSLSYWPNNPGVFDPSVDQLVSFATANNIYVIIEFDGLPWGSSEVFRMQSNPTDWINWVLHFVNRYSNTPTVAGFEIWNEPSSADFSQAQLRSIATQCYAAIRAANPNALVIVPSIPFGEVNRDWISNPLGPQAVYGWDDYWFHADYSWFRAPYDEGNLLLGLQRMKQYLSYKNLDANVPIIDTESGWLPSDSVAAVNDWYSILNAAETGWYTFAWMPNPSNYGLYDGATNTLTPQAQVMKNYLVSTAAPSLANVQVQVSGGGVTNPAAGTYQWPVGSTQILLATPNSGSSFDHWELTGGATSSANPLSFVVYGDGYAKAVFVVSSPTPPTPPPSGGSDVFGWLHTDGKYIKNQAGQVVFLRGVALPDLANEIWWNGGTGKFDLMQDLLEGKVNVVRCVISPYPNGKLDYWPNNPGVFDPSVDQLVSFATANNIHVIIEFDGLPWGSSEVFRMQSNPADWINWVLHFVNRYKNTPTVAGFEIWNEPSSADFTQAKWRSIATQCYTAIRAANPNALIIVPSIPFGEVSQDWVNNPLGPQAVYGWDDYWFHADYSWFRTPYDQGNYVLGLQRMKQYLSYKNLNANVPIIDTESGWLPTDNVVAVGDWYSILNAAETGWYTFAWMPNPDNYGLYNGATNTLTPQAQVMKNYLVSGTPVSLANIQMQVSGGGVTEPGVGTYQWPVGSTQILLATPNSVSSFDHWELTGGATSSANPISFTVNGDGYARAVFIVNSPTPPPSGESGVFGYQTIGSSNEGANRIVGSVFACSQAGVATGLSVAVRSSSGVALGLKGAIYRESDLALVGVTQEVSVPAWFEGWQTLSFSSQPSLSAGVNYILVAFSQSVGGNFLSVYCSSGAANQGYAQGNVAYSNYPETLSPSHGSLMYSIYCTYTISSATPPTPPPSGESGVFGYQTVGSGHVGADKPFGSVFACSQAGSAVSLSVAVRSSSSQALSLKGAIYRQSDLSLVAVTDEVSVPAWFEGWQTLSFESHPALSAGTDYVLMVFSATVGGEFLSVACEAGSAGQGFVQGDLTYPNFPGVLSPSLNSLQCSIYCTYQS